MGLAFPLAAEFLGGATGGTDPAMLEALLREAWERAARSWPGVHVEPLVFVRHLAQRVGDSGASSATLAQLAVEDLYLCRAALDGDARALLAFDQLLAASHGALRRIGGDASFVDEVTQQSRAKLLVAGFDGTRAEPRLATYGGRGDLRGFLRVLLVREALDHKRGWQRARAHADQAAAEPAASLGTNVVGADQDPEVLHLRRRYGPAFELAFADAVQALDASQRTLLRYHYLDRLNIDQIGALEGVHRVSAARRLTRVRDALVAETRRLLAERLELSPTELRSVLRLLESDVDVSVKRLLAS
jgi:RNA polymerase sigma-70 factor (ECF subfamily)